MMHTRYSAYAEVYKRMAAAEAVLEANGPDAMGRTAEEMAAIVKKFNARWELMRNELHSVGFVLGAAQPW